MQTHLVSICRDFSHLLNDQGEKKRANKNSVVKGLLKSPRKASSELFHLFLITGKNGDRYWSLWLGSGCADETPGTLGLCHFLVPLELGQGGKEEEEVHARPLFCCLSGFVRVTVAFWDPLQEMPPVDKSILRDTLWDGGLKGEGKEERRWEGRMDEAVCHVPGLVVGVGQQGKGDPTQLRGKRQLVWGILFFHLELSNDTQESLCSPGLGRGWLLFDYAPNHWLGRKTGLSVEQALSPRPDSKLLSHPFFGSFIQSFIHSLIHSTCISL